MHNAQFDTSYSFDLFYQIHARYPQPSLFTLINGEYYRAFHNDSGLSLLKVKSDADALTVVPLIGEVPYERIKHMLGTDRHLSDFYNAARQNVKLWTIVNDLVGLPIYRSENIYEALIFVIIEQHISWVNAQKAQRVLVEWGNNFIEYEGRRHYAIPTARQLANASIEDLKPTKITFKRMQLLIDIAQMFVDDPRFDYEQGRYLSPDELYQKLLTIKGIGHWTASVVVSRARGEYPFVPHNDVALQAAVAEYFQVEKSPEATKAIFADYGEFGGLAAHFTLTKWVLDKYPLVSA